MPLVPLLIEMIGLPSILTFWVYAGLYPVFPEMHSAPINPQYQHMMLLGVCAWLITVGPKPQGLLESIYDCFSACTAKKAKVENVEKDKKDK